MLDSIPHVLRGMVCYGHELWVTTSSFLVCICAIAQEIILRLLRTFFLRRYFNPHVTRRNVYNNSLIMDSHCRGLIAILENV